MKIYNSVIPNLPFARFLMDLIALRMIIGWSFLNWNMRDSDNQYQIDAHFTIPSDICYFALGRYLQVIVIDVFAKVDDEYFYKESHEILIDDLLQGDMEIPTDELVIAQGLGGSTYINVRSCDWGLVYGTNKMLLTFNGAYGSFLEKIGGEWDAPPMLPVAMLMEMVRMM